MTHGDDQGLIFPPRLAPIQIAIVPIYRNPEQKAAVMPVVQKLGEELSDFRVKIDDRDEVTPGFKYNHWELRGVPLRIEVGPRDIEKSSVMTSRRDQPGKPGKKIFPMENLPAQIGELLDDIQTAMLERATSFRDEHIHDVDDYETLKGMLCKMAGPFSWWCGDAACEAAVKADTKATIRCIPIEQPGGTGKCVYCGKEAEEKAYFAKAY